MNAQPADIPTPYPDSVSLRELNQRSGRIIAQVTESGRPVTVTDRGRPIAQIVPIRDDETWYGRMVREGKVRRAADDWALPARRWGTPEGFDLEQFLLGEREEDR